MKNKRYEYDVHYIRRNCWKKYPIKRMRTLRTAANFLGCPSYPFYLHWAVRKKMRTVESVNPAIRCVLDC